MSGLQEAFRSVHRVLRGDAPAEAAVNLGLDPARLAYYRDAVYGHVLDVLQKNFAALAGLLGPEPFERLAREHFATRPPGDFELNESAAEFAELLAGCAREGRHGVTPFHVALAELEWQEFRAYISPEVIPDRQTLTAPALNPTLAILQFETTVSGFLDAWRAREPGEPEVTIPLDETPETVFVLRHPETENALFVQADEGLLFALKVASDGLMVSQAAAASSLTEATVTEILRRAADWGVVLLPPELHAN